MNFLNFDFKNKTSVVTLTLYLLSFSSISNANSSKMKSVVEEVSKMYLSSMTFIFKNQKLINQIGGDKSDLFGQKFLNNIKSTYKAKFNEKFPKLDHIAKKMLIHGMVEVMEANKTIINDEQISFKGVIPATFAFQLAENVTAKGVGLKIKFTNTGVTRNRLNMPDEWEKMALNIILKNKKIYYDGSANVDGIPSYRQMTPLPMKAFCLKCHGVIEQNPMNEGKPKAQWSDIDKTGFKMEGWTMKDSGGGVSISISH